MKPELLTSVKTTLSNTHMPAISRHAPVLAGLLINLIATGYALINPSMGTQLFTLYGISTGALYGYSQQELHSTKDRENEPP
jgi:hypothetical protein